MSLVLSSAVFTASGKDYQITGTIVEVDG